MIHSTSSKRQFVQGAPCSTTLHLTFRARQHWQAFEARLLIARKLDACVFPAAVLLLFIPITVVASGEDVQLDDSPIVN